MNEIYFADRKTIGSMLQTQIRIGKQVSQGRGDWEDILDRPTIETETKKGDSITNYVLVLVFNLDELRIEVSSANLNEYDPDNSPERFFNVKVQGGNNKAVYVCAETKKLEQLRKSFFGIPDKKTKAEPEKGQFTEAIDKDFPLIQGTDVYQTLAEIFKLRADFEERFTSAKKDEVAADERKVLEQLSLKANERVVLVTVAVVWSEKGWKLPVLFREISGYQDFLKQKFLAESQHTGTSDKLSVERLCYATGLPSGQVGELNISERYSLNKMFVTTTINYATNWDGATFQRNYQIDTETQSYLERGSKYLLENYKTKIASIDHCIIPQLFSRDDTGDIEQTLGRLKGQSDLLFQYKVFQSMAETLEDEVQLQLPYWITFLGFESDGNFFKTISIIKDVSRTHFEALIEAFRKTHLAFKDISGMEWENIMSVGKERTSLTFNLFTVYGLIPLRKDKEKKNEALNLFRQVLEKRPIERHKLFGYFKELILCHRFERYGSYTNIYPNTAFDFAIRNAVFQYLAFIHVLNQFNLLIPMEEPNQSDMVEVIPVEQLPDYQQRIEEFFNKMAYTDAQKALFHLGRALNVVAYKQYSKGYESKPVLNKLNYNGMDKDDVLRLRKDLAEKTQQFSLHGLTEYSFGRFTQLFDYNSWSLKPDETLFFILSGYSFFAQKKGPKTK